MVVEKFGVLTGERPGHMLVIYNDYLWAFLSEMFHKLQLEIFNKLFVTLFFFRVHWNSVSSFSCMKHPFIMFFRTHPTFPLWRLNLYFVYYLSAVLLRAVSYFYWSKLLGQNTKENFLLKNSCWAFNFVSEGLKKTKCYNFFFAATETFMNEGFTETNIEIDQNLAFGSNVYNSIKKKFLFFKVPWDKHVKWK